MQSPTSIRHNGAKLRRIKNQFKFAALAFISAGLVLIAGVKLESVFAPAKVASTPSPPAIVKDATAADSEGQNQPVTSSSKIKPPVAGPTTTQSTTPTTKSNSATASSTQKQPATGSSIPSNNQVEPASGDLTLDPASGALQLNPSSRQAFAPKAAQTSYGHFPYDEAPPERLVPAGRFVRDSYERSEKLDFETDQAFNAMREAARNQGVQMMIISGFRNISDQQGLFERQISRRGSPEAAAQYSAPPGHSEHHTGYALDIADVQRPDADLKLTFQDTEVYRWLMANARPYGFEQSFPEGNAQGVSFEPWHWRFTKTPRSQEIFAAAKRA